MFEDLLPSAACAEMFSDVPESAMYFAEAATVAGAVEERRREFGTVRHCARKALKSIGFDATPILPDIDGVPRWPAGVVGSMTHCKGYRAAVVAPSSVLRSIGIDAEINAPLPSMLHDLVLSDDELVHVRELSGAYPGTHWDRIIFCAKEAVFKAWFPVTRTWLDYPDVSVTLHADNAFSAFVHAYPTAGVGPAFVGRWMTTKSFILAATWIRQSLARGEASRILSGAPAATQMAVEAYAG